MIQINDEDFGAPAQSYNTIYYTDRGQQSTTENKVYAKRVTNNTNDKNRYYIRVLNGLVFDPWGIDANRFDRDICVFKKVSKRTFDMYIKYLESRNKNFLARAERSFIHGE